MPCRDALLPLQTAAAAGGVSAQLAQAQLERFLPLTNELNPDEVDDAEDSEVRDTFMVSASNLGGAFVCQGHSLPFIGTMQMPSRSAQRGLHPVPFLQLLLHLL